MVITFDYDSGYLYGPAMPKMELLVRPLGEKEGSSAIMAIVDSGADATILPTNLLVAAGVERVGRARMRWGSNPGQPYDVFLAVVEIGPIKIPGVRILAGKTGDDSVIGRDILNHLVVTLNGPANALEIQTE